MMKRINIIVSFFVLIVTSGCSTIFDVEVKKTETNTNVVGDSENTCELIGKETTEVVKLEKEVLELSEEVEPGVVYTFHFNYQIEKNVATRLNVENELYTFEYNAHSTIDVEIYDNQETLIQTMSYEATIDAGEAIFRATAIEGIKIVDFNFDGYLDILSKKESGGSKGAFTCIGWIYQPETGLFEETNISDIVNLSIDKENCCIRGYNISGAASKDFYIYRFQNDKFELTDQLELTILRNHEIDMETLDYNYIEYTGKIIKVKIRENRNGTMQDVFPLISDTPEGRQQIFDYLYGEHSLWVDENGYIIYRIKDQT